MRRNVCELLPYRQVVVFCWEDEALSIYVEQQQHPARCVRFSVVIVVDVFTTLHSVWFELSLDISSSLCKDRIKLQIMMKNVKL